MQEDSERALVELVLLVVDVVDGRLGAAGCCLSICGRRVECWWWCEETVDGEVDCAVDDGASWSQLRGLVVDAVPPGPFSY